MEDAYWCHLCSKHVSVVQKRPEAEGSGSADNDWEWACTECGDTFVEAVARESAAEQASNPASNDTSSSATPGGDGASSARARGAPQGNAQHFTWSGSASSGLPFTFSFSSSSSSTNYTGGAMPRANVDALPDAQDGSRCTSYVFDRKHCCRSQL